MRTRKQEPGFVGRHDFLDCALHPAVRTVLLFAVLAWNACGGLSAAANEAAWTEDFEAAKAKAQKEGKDLLLDFTGSDWCHWCIQLRNEVFDTELFKKEAPKHFVLVEVDFPRRKAQTAERKRRNQELGQWLQVEGFPTIFLLDAKGRPYGKTGYQAGGPKAYLAHLVEIRKRREKRDAFFAQAAQAEGAEKAKLLDRGLSTLELEAFSTDYQDVIEQIVSADAQNKAGLKKKYAVKKQMAGMEKALAAHGWPEVLKQTGAIMRDESLDGATRQAAAFIKARALHEQFYSKLKELFEAAYKLDPKTKKAERIQQLLEQLQAEQGP